MGVDPVAPAFGLSAALFLSAAALFVWALVMVGRTWRVLHSGLATVGTVVDGDDPGVLADNRLTGTMRQFGYDARTGSVVVVFDAVRPGEGSSVTTRRFEAIVGASGLR